MYKPLVGAITLSNTTDQGDHTSWIHAVSWSPDGKHLASGSQDQSVRVWDSSSGSCIFELLGHSGEVLCVCWSPDSNQLASGSVDRTVCVWDAANGARLRVFAGHNDFVWSVRWSADGTRLASGSSDRTALVRAHACKFINRLLGRTTLPYP